MMNNIQKQFPINQKFSSSTDVQNRKASTSSQEGLSPSIQDSVILKPKPQPKFGGIWGLTNPADWERLLIEGWDKISKDPDVRDFLDIVDGKTNDDYLLDKMINDQYLVNGEDGGIVINKPKIKIPNIHHGNKSNKKGVGSGDGKEGDVIGGGPPKPGEEEGKGAGNEKGKNPLGPWQHKYSPSEVAQMIGRQFGLPFLQPSDGDANRVRVVKDNTKPIAPGDLHRKKTFRNAIKRHVGTSVAKGEALDFNKMNVERPDKVYKATEYEPQPNLKVAVVYVADVSGSISKSMRDFTRVANQLTSYPLKYKYGLMAAELAGDEYSDSEYFGKDGTEEGGLKERFIVYTTEATEVSEKNFYKNTQSGGTVCSTGFKKALGIIEQDYPPSEGWNVYVYHFTDGDNSYNDKDDTVKVMKKLLDTGIRYIGNCDLGQSDTYPSGFRKATEEAFKDNPHVGCVASGKKAKYDLDDYKRVVGVFLPPQKDGELDWYDND